MKLKNALKEVGKKSLSKKDRIKLVRKIREERKELSSRDRTYLEDIGIYSLVFSGHDNAFEESLEGFDFKNDMDFSGAGGEYGGGGASSSWDSGSSYDSSSSSWDSGSSYDSSSSFSSDSGGGGGGGD
jgi:hypothetical protein